jgi:hypothetical protein
VFAATLRSKGIVVATYPSAGSGVTENDGSGATVTAGKV